MNITKIGHCCLLIQQGDTILLTDPGVYSTDQNEVEGIDAVLITHEHADHLHMDSLKTILDKNPKAQVITNTGVAKLLDEADITYTLLRDGEAMVVGDISIEAFEQEHAEIYPGLQQVLNTGFFIGKKLFYPGDAYIIPGKDVEMLALPVAGPWLKISEAIDYAVSVKPRRAFPVHDGILSDPVVGYRWPQTILPSHGIDFTPLANGESLDV